MVAMNSCGQKNVLEDTELNLFTEILKRPSLEELKNQNDFKVRKIISW